MVENICYVILWLQVIFSDLLNEFLVILSYLDSYFGGYLDIQIQLYNYQITPAHLEKTRR